MTPPATTTHANGPARRWTRHSCPECCCLHAQRCELSWLLCRRTEAAPARHVVAFDATLRATGNAPGACGTKHTNARSPHAPSAGFCCAGTGCTAATASSGARRSACALAFSATAGPSAVVETSADGRNFGWDTRVCGRAAASSAIAAGSYSLIPCVPIAPAGTASDDVQCSPRPFSEEPRAATVWPRAVTVWQPLCGPGQPLCGPGQPLRGPGSHALHSGASAAGWRRIGGGSGRYFRANGWSTRTASYGPRHACKRSQSLPGRICGAQCNPTSPACGARVVLRATAVGQLRECGT